MISVGIIIFMHGHDFAERGVQCWYVFLFLLASIPLGSEVTEFSLLLICLTSFHSLNFRFKSARVL